MPSSRVDSDQDRRRAAVDTWEGEVTTRVIARLTARRTAQVNARKCLCHLGAEWTWIPYAAA
jgi:hypothetical protein